MLFRYPGGKSRLKKVIVPKILESGCENFVEPFFGGGSVGISLLQNSVFRSYHFNDYDPHLMELWHAAFTNPLPLVELIERYTPNIESFYSFRDELSSPGCAVSLASGFKKLVLHQISFSGLGVMAGGPIGGKSQKSKYDVGCRWNAKVLTNKVKKLNQLFPKPKLTCLDFEKCLNLDKKAVCYVDPPYVVKGDQLYQVKFPLKKHARLVEILRHADFKWVLSYDNCDWVQKHYSFASIKELDTNYSIKNSGKAKELLISNY